MARKSNSFEIETNDSNKIVVAPKEFRGKLGLDLRSFWKNDKGEWLPTKKGVTIPADSVGEFFKFLDAVKDDFEPSARGKANKQGEWYYVVLENGVKVKTDTEMDFRSKRMWPTSKKGGGSELTEATKRAKSLAGKNEEAYKVCHMFLRIEDPSASPVRAEVLSSSVAKVLKE